MNSVRVRVPASSANLGPGFDCLALALNLHLEVFVGPSASGTQIEMTGEGSDHLPRDTTNMIYQGLHAVYQDRGRQVPALHLAVENQIPVKSGMGSSSAALVAGALAGYGLLSADPEPAFILQLARRVEGHADNAAASLFGGLVALSPGQQIEWLRLALEPINLVVVLPEVDVSTRQMREALPDQVEHALASRNLARLPFLIEALRCGDLELLSRASQDELHEPHRMSLIPGAVRAREAGLAVGAAAVVLSGAGPGLLAFADDKSRNGVAQAMQGAFEAGGVSARVFHFRPDFQGAVVSAIDA